MPVLRAHHKHPLNPCGDFPLPSTQAASEEPVTYLRTCMPESGTSQCSLAIGSPGELVALSLEERGEACIRDRGSSEELVLGLAGRDVASTAGS